MHSMNQMDQAEEFVSRESGEGVRRGWGQGACEEEVLITWAGGGEGGGGLGRGVQGPS